MGSAAKQQLLPGLPGRKFLASERRQLGDDPGIRVGMSPLQEKAPGAPRSHGWDKEQELRSCWSLEDGGDGEPQICTRDHSNPLEELTGKDKRETGSGKKGFEHLYRYKPVGFVQRARPTLNPPRAPWHRIPSASCKDSN